MKRALSSLALACLACRAIVGIDHIERAGDGGLSTDGGLEGGTVGTPAPLFQRGNDTVWKLVAHRDYVYALYSLEIDRCKGTGPSCGNTPETVAKDPVIIDDMAFGDRMFFSVSGSTDTLPDGGDYFLNDSKIVLADLDGKNAQTFKGALPNATRIAYAGDLYWVDDQAAQALPNNEKATVYRCPATGACPPAMDLTGHEAPDMVATSKAVFVHTVDVATSGERVVACLLGQVCGKTPKVIAAKTTADSFTADQDFAYGASSTTGELFRWDETGAEKKIIGGLPSPRGIAVDEKYVYWASSNGSVSRAPLDGSGQVQVLASGQAEPDTVAVDATNVYWSIASGSGGSTIMRLRKP